MMENYDKEFWEDKKCPKYDCRKNACKCGLKKVFLAAALGDDSENSPIAPKNGEYCNAIVVYEATGNVYIYSADGIPTLVEENVENIKKALKRLNTEINNEVHIRENADIALQQEIDDLKNSPDVVDIVATYADLQAYDTSGLGDKDVIRVLVDETHNGGSSYYRWNKQSETWTFIGTDSGKSTKVLTSADYNWNRDTQTEANPNCVAIWKLPSGIYYSASGVFIMYNKNFGVSYEAINIVSKHSGYVSYISVRNSDTNCGTVHTNGNPAIDDGRIMQWNNVVNDLTETGDYRVLDARQGKVLDEKIALKQDILTFDNTPTTSSNNPVKSDGIKKYVDALIITGTGVPTTSTIGTVGQLYEDTTNGNLYQCTAIVPGTDPDPDTYTWREIANIEQLSWRQRKPVVVWEVDGAVVTTGLVGVGEDISANPNWQLTGLDLTPYKRIKIFTRCAQKAGATASASTTPAMVLEMSLDPRAAIAEYGGNYVGSILAQKPNDANRLCTLTCAVSADKSKFEVLRMTSMYGTVVTSNSDVNAYVFKIEGYYD